MGRVSPSTGTQGPACGVSERYGVPEEPRNICPATRALQGLVQRGQARGQGRARARDPPWPGTLALTFTQRHEKAAEALGSRMEQQSGRCSPEAALQQWKIFPRWSQRRNLSLTPLGLGKSWGGSSLKVLPPSAIRECSQPQLSGEKPNPCPSHPLAGPGSGFSGYKIRQGPFLYALRRRCAPCLPVSACKDSPQAKTWFTRQGGKIKCQELPLLQDPRANALKAPMARNRGRNVYIQKWQLLLVSYVRGIHISMPRTYILLRSEEEQGHEGISMVIGLFPS